MQKQKQISSPCLTKAKVKEKSNYKRNTQHKLWSVVQSDRLTMTYFSVFGPLKIIFSEHINKTCRRQD